MPKDTTKLSHRASLTLIHAAIGEIQVTKNVDGWTDGFSALYSRLA